MVKGLSLPRVFTIHGFIYGDTEVSGKKWPWLRSRLWKWIETSGWADQPNIISISPYVRERVSSVVKNTVIHDIDNPISESFFHIARQPDPATIFSAAVISPRKNTLRLVQAVLKLKEAGVTAQLRLAGPVVNAAYGEELLSAIRRYDLEGSVQLLGRIGTKQVEAELARATVFALVSLEENSPMGIQEAMAASVPVVTSNRCGMPYMVRSGATGYLVDPENPDNIARRLKQLLESQSLCVQMGDEARRVALSRFHPDLVARRTREVYLEAIA
jgi:glycosyltransferase involved in cell wall biosynthesis